jgi:hypothetical protein
VSEDVELTGYLPRLGLGFIAACLSTVGLYGVLRIMQAHLFPEANPATVIWSAHAGYYWRCWTVAYAGGMVGFLAYGAAKRSPGRVARGLVHALTVAVVIIAYQGLMVP